MKHQLINTIITIMKTLLLISTIFFAGFYANAQEYEWQKQTPIPNFSYAKNVAFANENLGWISSGSGPTYRTEDGGSSWVEVNWELYNGNDMFFYNETLGIMTGSAGRVLITTDGGFNWVNKNINTGNELVSCTILGLDNYVAVDDAGKIYKTINGGNTWNISLSLENSAFVSVCFINENKGWAVGSQNVDNWNVPLFCKTIDGGQNWDILVMTEYVGQVTNLRDIDFYDEMHGIACGKSGALFYTENGGQSWQSNFLNGELSLIDVHTGPTSFLLEEAGDIYRSSDFGETWEIIESQNNKQLADICSLGDETFMAVGPLGNVLKTYNNGDSWEKLHQGISNGYIRDMYFSNQNTGWALGETGTILFTENGGENWDEIYFDKYYIFSAFHVLNPSTIWATGRNFDGTFAAVYTEDGGETWSVLENLPVNFIPRSIACVNSNTICITATQFGTSVGYIFRTTDKGENWTSSLIDPVFLVVGDMDMVFTSETNGFIGGSFGFFYRTSDAGITWIPENTGVPAGFINKLSFYDEQHGVLANASLQGGQFYIGITSDGGDTWDLRQCPNAFKGIFMLNPAEIYGFSNSSSQYLLWYSNDGGENWEVIFEHDANLSSVFAADNANIWVGADFGNIHFGSLITGLESQPSTDDNSMIKLYPNPAHGKAFIKLSEELQAPLKIEMFSINGHIIKSIAIANSNESWMELNIRDIIPGFYFLKVSTAKEVFVRKLVIE
jgi:photosystem II stability/assembly factor-like uncharacterized protein